MDRICRRNNCKNIVTGRKKFCSDSCKHKHRYWKENYDFDITPVPPHVVNIFKAHQRLRNNIIIGVVIPERSSVIVDAMDQVWDSLADTAGARYEDVRSLIVRSEPVVTCGCGRKTQITYYCKVCRYVYCENCRSDRHPRVCKEEVDR